LGKELERNRLTGWTAAHRTTETTMKRHETILEFTRTRPNDETYQARDDFYGHFTEMSLSRLYSINW
jgi:hypothetical protein